MESIVDSDQHADVFKPFHYAIVIALTGPIIGITTISYNGNQQRKN